LNPHSISHVSVNISSEVGANDALVGVRVVPAGRDGFRVLGRSLREDEADTGESVAFYPYAGEELHFPAGSIRVFLRDVDKESVPGPSGYARVSNTLWTWLRWGSPPNPSFFRFLFATGRRLDSAHDLCVSVLEALTDRPEAFIRARGRLLGALANAELMCIAFGRAIDMLLDIPSRFSISVVVPAAAAAALPALREIRNAFEHIEDRALGNVRGKPHPEALSIFEQSDLISHGVLRYGSHSLSMKDDILPMLVDARRSLVEIAAAFAGTAKTIDVAVTFPAAPPGSHDRIRQRAYLLWENRTGSSWWDPNSNWFEAERVDMADARGAG